MRFLVFRILSIQLAFLFAVAAFPWQRAHAGQTNPVELRAQFFKLCDVAVAKVTNAKSKGPFFVDSYAVRALCVAYDMTGNQKYLDACRDWSERMVKYQNQMIPHGAYYMHYNRKPGETNGDWYAADSGSIGMAVLATSVRCKGVEQKRFLNSAKNFANLVIKNYVKPSGGISDGLWHQSSDAWWCSSGIDGSFLFNLYAVTGNKRYLKTALGATDWLNDLDLTKKQPFPLSQQGPAMIFYVMENYSAGWPYISKDVARKKAAAAKVSWCLQWMESHQQKPVKHRQWVVHRPLRTLTPAQQSMKVEKVIMQGRWPISKGWGMKFGGLPFHEYIFSHYLPAGEKLMAEGDTELQRLAPVVFTGKPKFNQLSAFMMMSYAERLEPGAIYRSGK